MGLEGWAHLRGTRGSRGQQSTLRVLRGETACVVSTGDGRPGSLRQPGVCGLALAGMRSTEFLSREAHDLRKINVKDA